MLKLQLFSKKNIFLSKSNKNIYEITNLNKYNNHPCIYSKEDDSIVKHFLSYNFFNWEKSVSLYLNQSIFSKLIPEFIINDLSIAYNVKNLVSLRYYLSKKKINQFHIFNEIFSFVKNFKRANFIHGNLNIDNIFVDKYNNNFYILDYSNSYIIENDHIKSLQKNISYNEEAPDPIKYNFINYWDTFMIYISLLNFYDKNTNIIDYLNKLLYEYIDEENIICLKNFYNIYKLY